MKRYEYSDEQRTLLEHLRVPFAVYQLIDQRIVTLILSDGLIELFGYNDREQAYRDMAQNTFQYEHPDDAARVADAALRFSEGDGTLNVIYRACAKGSSDYHIIHAVGQHIYTQSGERLAHVWYTDEGMYTGEGESGAGILSSTLNHALYEESILRDSYYDHLTGLPSMTYFFDLAQAGKTAIEKSGNEAVMLFLDLCGMKYYNSKYGFSEGDKLLRAFAGLLVETFSNENCCRAGADHFAVYTVKEGIEDILNGLFVKAGALNGGNSIPVHVGIYVAGTENISASGAFDRAKFATDALKHRYGCCFTYYRTELRNDVEHRQYILSNLDRAIDEGWIKVYYQGIVRAVTGKISDEEALARWIDPVRGMLSPGEFIPYLEEADLIYKLDLYVLEQVLDKINLLKKRGIYVIPHSINLSRSDFDSCDIVEEIRQRVDAAGVSRDKISIEITESIIGSDFDFIKEQVERFQKLGFPVWLDDFGSGYSSFDVMQSIQFDLVKFDMSFMKKLDQGKNAKVTLTELMRLAIKLGMDTICEGVETEEQVRFLKEIGCSKLQGYYYSKPTPLPRIMEVMDAVAAHDLENPEEGKYYETIGRTNLYDFSVFADEDDSLFQNIFSTIPMGIIEVDDDEIKYIRTNRSYREFLNRFLGIRISDGKGIFTKSLEGYSPSYIKTLQRCCETDGRVMFNEQMPDGSKVHSFLKRIGVNPVSKAVAIAVAVLSIASPDDGAAYADIARALATEYYNIYYVDLETDRFIEYSLPSSGEAELAFERHGEDFFTELRNDAMSHVHEEDRKQFLEGLFKENIVKEVDKHGSFMKTFRMIEEGTAMYAEMKISRMYPGGKHLIIGISVVDSKMKQKEILDRIQKERDTMTRVMALTDGYLALYTINAENNHYVEYTASEEYESLAYPKMGEDFFRQGIIDGKRTVWKEDLPFYLEKFTKQQVMDRVRREGKYRLSYSLVIHGKLKQVSLIIVPLNEGEEEMLIAGVREEDSMRCLR